jgi:hypothetical protein
VALHLVVAGVEADLLFHLAAAAAAAARLQAAAAVEEAAARLQGEVGAVGVGVRHLAQEGAEEVAGVEGA